MTWPEWSKGNSKTYIHFGYVEPAYKKAQILIKGFVALKRKTFVRLKAYNITIPERSSNGKPLLETLLEKDLPEKLKREIKKLIKLRERCIPYVIPVLRRCAKNFLATKLKMSQPAVDRIVQTVGFEKALAFAARQGIDRTDKIGIRLDFVLSTMTRLFPEIFYKFNTYSISNERHAELGEIQEWKVSKNN